MSDPQSPRRLGASILSILAGFVAVVILSIGTDILLHYVAGFPKPGEVFSDWQFRWATIYRTLYGIIGSYITASVAPARPMMHSLIGGAIGLVLSAAGVVAALIVGPKLGPLWYPIALFLGTLPTAWLGAKIRIVQTS